MIPRFISELACTVIENIAPEWFGEGKMISTLVKLRFLAYGDPY